MLNKIRETVTEARENKKTFTEFVRKSSSKDSEKELKAKTAELAKSERRLAELYRIMKRLFEDSVSERISDEQYDMFRTDYEKEQAALKTAVEVLKAEIGSMRENEANVDSFLSLAERYVEFSELTAQTAREFVKKIVVHEPIRPEGFTKKILSQKVQVYFNHIGEYDSE